MRFTIIKNDNNTSIPEVYYDFLPPGGTIGRSIDNTLVLTDENRTISRLQAIVHISVDGACHIVNKGTVTPLYLNGIIIEKDIKFKINHGDHINIANYTILVSDPAVNESTFIQASNEQEIPLQENNIISSHNEYQPYLNNNVKQTQHADIKIDTDNKIPLTTNDELLLNDSISQYDYDIKTQTNINADKISETIPITEISTEQLTTDIAITDSKTQKDHNVLNTPNIIALTDISDHGHSSTVTEIKNGTTSSIKSDIHAITVSTSFLASSVGENTIMTNKTSKPNISASNSPDDQSVSNTEEDIPKEIWDDLLSEFSATAVNPNNNSLNTQAQSLYQNDTIMTYNEHNINSRDPLSQLDAPLELDSLKQQTQDVSTLFNEPANINHQSDIFNPTPTTLIAESAPESTIPGITNAQPVTSTLTENLEQPFEPANLSADLTMGQPNNSPVDDPLSLFTNNNLSHNHTEDPFGILNNAAPLTQVETDTLSTTVFPEQTIPVDPYWQNNSPPPSMNTLSGSQPDFATDLASPTMPHSPLNEPSHNPISAIDNRQAQQHLHTNPTQPQYHNVNTQHQSENVRSQTQHQQTMQPNSAQNLMMQPPIEESLSIPLDPLQDQQHQYQQDLQQQALQQQMLHQQTLQQQTLHQQTLQQQTLQQQTLQQQTLQQQTLQQQALQQQTLQQQALQQQALQQQTLQQQTLQQQTLQQQTLHQQTLQQQTLQQPLQQPLQQQTLQSQQLTQQNAQSSINPQPQFSSQPNNDQPYLNSSLPLNSLDQQQPDIFQAAQANQPPQTMPYNESKMATMPNTASQVNMENTSRPFRKIKGVNNKRLDINPVKSSVPNVQINTEHVLQDDMLNALLEGIGLSDMNPHPVFDAERVKLLGRLVSVYFQGTIALLQSRNILKDFIISNDDRTMILEEANNPFKLLPTGKTVLMQMFGSPMPGFMEPEQAVMDALIDLQAHQLGMIAGIRAIIAAMLQTFNPDKIEADAKQKDSLPAFSLSWRKKAALWDLYVKNYHKVAGEIDDDFITHFGDAFSLAYKVEVEQYKQAQKKRDKQ